MPNCCIVASLQEIVNNKPHSTHTRTHTTHTRLSVALRCCCSCCSWPTRKRNRIEPCKPRCQSMNVVAPFLWPLHVVVVVFVSVVDTAVFVITATKLLIFCFIFYWKFLLFCFLFFEYPIASTLRLRAAAR